MLSSAHRLRTREDFARALRDGRRAPGRVLVLHLAQTDGLHPAQNGGAEPPRAGLAVSKAVGTSVVRHRVARRLRHLLRERIQTLPEGSLLVVRALPQAATASFPELAAALDAGLRRLQPVTAAQR